MITGEFLNKLATKVGIKIDNPALKALLSNVTFSGTEIPDELANAIDSGLMDLEAAKANPDVISAIATKVKGETLNGADKVIEKLLTEFAYDEADVADIRADKNTFSRMEKVGKKIKELEAKKSGANAPDKAAYQKQIDELNGKLSTMVADKEKEITELKSKHTTELTNIELKTLIANKKLSLPDDMDPQVKTDIALRIVQTDLQTKGFQIVKSTDGKLEVKRADGTDAYDASNRKVDLTNLIDGALAQNKLLAVNEPGAPVKGAAPVVIPGQGTQPAVNQSAIEIINQQIADANRQS